MPHDLTTRPALPTDKPAMMSVIASVGLFPHEELREMERLLDDCFTQALGEDHRLRVAALREQAALKEEIIGVVYYAPERMTAGTWNAYFIGIDPQWQGKGYGAALLTAVEHELATQHQRLLLVETSGLPELAATRAFYHRRGYEQEACIREFYKAGDDKIVFRKPLQSPTATEGDPA